MSYPFPSKLINTKTKAGRIHARRLEGRRKGLERFLHLLEAYFQTFSTFLLEKKLYRDGCAVLTAYGTFMGVFDHFPSLTRSCISAPLTLKAWRENLEASILKACEEEEEEEEEEQQQQQQQEEEELQTKAQPVPVPELEQISTNVSKESVVSCLPRLTIRSTNVETMQTFLEDFCDHLLTHYGNDLEELQDEDSTLTLARRWELCLFVAARIGHTYAVQLILFYYVHDPNITLHDGSTCLNIASRMGHSEIVSILLQEKADVHQPNQAGITPLIAASRNGCLEVVKILLNAGARVTDKSARGTFPLHAAIVSQNEEIVELLLQHGADVDVCTESGIAPLHFAAKLGNLKICELLIAYNVNVYQRTKNNSDAYAIAIANEHTKVAQLLEQALHSRRCGRHSTGNIFSNIHTAASPPSVDGVYPTVIPSPPRTSVSSTRCGSRTSGGRGLLYRGRSVFTNFALAAGSLSMSNRHLNMHETTQRSRHHHQS
jgi:ankyrin repeat protein